MKSPEFLVSKGVDLQKSLELFGNIETYNDTIGDFIVSTESKLNKLKEYISNKDMANYAIYVHSIKSDARYFGFTKLVDIAYEHELKSKAGDLYYINENFNNLSNAVNEATTIVKDYLYGTNDTLIKQSTQISSPTTEIYDKKTIFVVDDSNIIKVNQDNDNIVAILLDLNMPRVDGFKVLEYMQENSLFNKMPVSIISGDSSKETIDKAFNYQIIDMLGKPFTDADVKRVVEKTIMYKDLI